MSWTMLGQRPRRPHGATLAVVLVLLLVPLAFAEMPVLLDYPNHLARAVILAGQAPEAEAWFAPDWRVLPNLAFDLLMMPLLRVLGPHEAGRIVIGLAAGLGVLGTLAYHRAVFRRASWWPLGAGLIAWHGLLLLGFLSFSIGVGLALLAAALWIGGGPAASRWRLLGFAALATLVALSHLFAFGFLGLLVLGRILAERRLAQADALRLALSLAPGALIALQAFGGGGDTRLLWEYHERAGRALAPFAGYQIWLDRFAIVTLAATLAIAAWLRRLEADRGSLLALGFCGLAFLASPSVVGGGAFAETRFSVFVAFLLFAGLDVRLPWPAALPLTTVGASRLLALGLAWNTQQNDIAELRRALAETPRGAAVMTVAVRRADALAYFTSQRRRGLISFLYIWPDQHLGALATVERGARWPALFAVPGQQPLRGLAPANGFSPNFWHSLPPPLVLDTARPPPPQFAQVHAVWADWPQRFDYVLLLHARATPRPPEFTTAPLAPVVDTGFAALYSVRR